MTSLEVVWWLMGLSLIVYALTGGADFGGGMWSLLANGPRKAEQRKAVEDAIGPIWEANHVWLIFIIVLMFTAFPKGFSAMGIALHIPIVLVLIGIILRGSGFIFRAYGMSDPQGQAMWGRVFEWSSLITPFFLGTCAGALCSGAIRVGPAGVTTGYLAGWLSPFGLLTGLLTVVLFALLAAVYLAADTEGDVQQDFGKRALVMEGLGAIVAFGVLLAASHEAPVIFERLLNGSGAWPLHLATATAAITTTLCILKRRYAMARLSAALQVGLVVFGWGLAMDQMLIVPDLSIQNAGGRPELIAQILPWIGAGLCLLIPALIYLFVVFKARHRPSAQ
jgi:cytochrome d ubiquinol oxidase subunit II